jgi:hypothetical protein
MDKSIRDHVERIRSFIQQLESDLPQTQSDPMEALKTEADLRSLRLALMHYELALEIEKEVIEGRTSRGVSRH